MPGFIFSGEFTPLCKTIAKKYGIDKLSKALKEAENKRKGISGDTEAIKEKLKVIMDAVYNPVPNRVIDDE